MRENATPSEGVQSRFTAKMASGKSVAEVYVSYSFGRSRDFTGMRYTLSYPEKS